MSHLKRLLRKVRLTRFVSLLLVIASAVLLISWSQSLLLEWLVSMRKVFTAKVDLELLVVALLFFLGSVLWHWKELWNWLKGSRRAILLWSITLALLLAAAVLLSLSMLAASVLIVLTAVSAAAIFRGLIQKTSLAAGKGIDDPLDDPRGDTLGRAQFSRDLFRFVRNLPAENPTRVAITGDWGSGKTTVLNFIRWYARRADYAVVFFSPWQYGDPSEAWKGFVKAVDIGIASWRGTPVGPLKRGNVIAKSLRITSKVLRHAAGLEGIGDLFDDLLGARLAKSLGQTKLRVSQVLGRELGDKSLVVLVDDLDRARPEVVYDTLLFIKEILDVQHCVFLCAFDVVALSQILSMRFQISDVQLFLQKIFPLTYPLPTPRISDRERFMDLELKSVEGLVKRPVVERWKSLLPLENPRRVKRYLKHLYTLHSLFLRRFGDDDLDWELVYLAELLKLEFPEAAAAVFWDSSFVDWLAMVDYHRRHQEEEKIRDLERWKARYVELPESKLSQPELDRFYQVAEAMVERATFKDREIISYHLRVLEHPEVLTWKEYRRWYQIFKKRKNPNSVTRVLTDARVPIEKRREFLRALMRERHSELKREAEAQTQAQRIVHLERASELTDDCLWLADLGALFAGESPAFDTSVLTEWFSQSEKYMHFNNEFYQAVRQKEEQLRQKLAEQSGTQASALLQAMAGPFAELTEAAGPAHWEIWKCAVASQLVQRFREKDGIKNIWPRNKALPEKRLLLAANPYFHKPEVYDLLESIAKQAGESDEVQENFIECATLLFYAALIAGSGFNRDQALAVLADDRFREMIWRAATARRVHRRVIGSLLRYRHDYILATGNAATLSIPQWVREMEPDLLTIDWDRETA